MQPSRCFRIGQTSATVVRMIQYEREVEKQKLEHQTSAAEKIEAVLGDIRVRAAALSPLSSRDFVKRRNDDRTYLKVGMSENDAIKRFRQQRGSTALPEPPILLRIYVGSNGMDIAEVESRNSPSSET